MREGSESILVSKEIMMNNPTRWFKSTVAILSCFMVLSYKFYSYWRTIDIYFVALYFYNNKLSHYEGGQ